MCELRELSQRDARCGNGQYLEKPLMCFALFTAIFAIAQCVLWLVLSIFLIIMCFTTRMDFPVGDTYWTVFYDIFIKSGGMSFLKLHEVMVVYIILYVVWLIASLWLIIRIWRLDGFGFCQSAQCAYVTWAFITFMICTFDVIIAVWMLHDFIFSAYSKYQSATTIIVRIAMLGFALRFVVIWAYNLISSILLFTAYSNRKMYTRIRPHPDGEIQSVKKTPIQSSVASKTSSEYLASKTGSDVLDPVKVDLKY